MGGQVIYEVQKVLQDVRGVRDEYTRGYRAGVNDAVKAIRAVQKKDSVVNSDDKKKKAAPSCYGLYRGPQSDAENDCEACSFSRACGTIYTERHVK